MMSDALVTIDAGQPGLESLRHHFLGGFCLFVRIHGPRRVAIAAFVRIVLFHGRPDVLGEFKPMLLEFLRGTDGPEDLVQDLVAGLDLAPDLVKPFVRNVAVRTSRPHARPVLEVDGFLKFLVRVVPHLMARGAERLGIRQLQGPIEAAPEQHSADAADDEQCRERKTRTWAPEKCPDACNQIPLGGRATK
jgi:hypothetical protein